MSGRCDHRESHIVERASSLYDSSEYRIERTIIQATRQALRDLVTGVCFKYVARACQSKTVPPVFQELVSILQEPTGVHIFIEVASFVIL
eukprot:scaffold6862_cov92-Skeletonema_dohrnii-CCMP3373.AAC.7